MLGRQCSIYDVDDIEAFVRMCIKRSGVKPLVHEWEDLVAEGVCLLWAMSNSYKPKLDGYEQEGRFSGYAIKYMPRKIRESYNRNTEHALHRTQPDGTRKWEYYERAVSYDELVQERREDSHPFHESTVRVVGDFVQPRKVLDPAEPKLPELKSWGDNSIEGYADGQSSETDAP